jgi:hypothetical protein
MFRDPASVSIHHNHICNVSALHLFCFRAISYETSRPPGLGCCIFKASDEQTSINGWNFRATGSKSLLISLLKSSFAEIPYGLNRLSCPQHSMEAARYAEMTRSQLGSAPNRLSSPQSLAWRFKVQVDSMSRSPDRGCTHQTGLACRSLPMPTSNSGPVGASLR